FASAVHCAVEVGFLGNFLAAAAGFDLVDRAGVDVGVDGHLLAGHGIEGEAGGDFGNSGCAFGDDHELNHHDDGEDDDADGQGIAGDEIAEGEDHFAGLVLGLGGGGAAVADGEDQTRGGGVEDETEKGRGKEERGEDGEFEGGLDINRGDEDDGGEGQVENEE